MTSSTLSSDTLAVPATVPVRSWRRWILTFTGIFYGLAAFLFVLLLLIDPYDSDRFPNFGIIGIDDHNPRMAHVSRARDPQFDSAIYGNSTGQLIDPRHLFAGTGLKFTQLTIPAVGPREQLAIMRWTRARHEQIGAWVVIADTSWCSPDPNLPLEYPFPFWLYGSDIDYLRNVFNSKSLDRAVWRVQLAFGQRRRSDPADYYDKVAPPEGVFVGYAPPVANGLTAADPGADFPWITELRHMIARLPPDAAVVLVMPPVYHTLLPAPGSREAARVARCKAALAEAVAGRPRSGLLDFRIDAPEVHEAKNFVDRVHYRTKIAGEIEDRIIATLRAPVTASRF